MLKMTRSSDKSAPSKNDSSRLAFSKNNNNKPASGKNNGDGVIDGFGGEKYAKKSEKSKGQKLTKFRKLSKSEISKSEKSKKSSKSRNSSNFDATKTGPSFLTPDARMAFNYLWLTFTEAPIFWHFNPEC